jgi:hypothetical protein
VRGRNPGVIGSAGCVFFRHRKSETSHRKKRTSQANMRLVYAPHLTLGQIESNRKLRCQPLAVGHDDQDVLLRFVEVQ